MMNDTLMLCPAAAKAIEWLGGIPDTCSVPEIQAHAAGLFGGGFDMSRIKNIIPDTCDTDRKVSLYTIYSLIYLFTGKYPEEIWGNDMFTSGTELGSYRELHESYISACSRLDIPARLKAMNADAVEFMESGIKGALVKKLIDVSVFKNRAIAEFLTEGAVFRDRSYVSRYKPSKWKAMLEKARESRLFPIPAVCSSNKSVDGFLLHSVTVMGENHTKCDDFSGIVSLGTNAWFAYCADGVGSEPQSHLGSRIAGECFMKCIRDRLFRHDSAKKLAYYIQNSLAKEAAAMWKKRIRRLSPGDSSCASFASTFLFAFGCRAFIACGIVGDGNFMVEKTPLSKKSDTVGYISVDDGYSKYGSTGGVATVAHLAENPSAMQIRFFNPCEVSAIIMTSDGADGLTFDDAGGVLLASRQNPYNLRHTFGELRGASFTALPACLHRLAVSCSSSNKTMGGRGDDCSIVYIRNKTRR